ncbi:MAG: DUF3516 domain-containing protein, partial [Deltaproteobacteria bacterium]|nr:DUF3516 domain-containing protein [Deltaproteobacteria bacterium]
EDPEVVLHRQLDKLKGERLAALKAAGVPYEERMEELEKLEPPRPNAELIHGMFAGFAEKHPWIGREDVRPKSIARDLVERMQDFNGYVLELGLQRSEGVLLRYLSEVVRVLSRTVPETMRDEATDDLLLYLRDAVRSIDASLLDEWERLRSGEAIRAEEPREERPQPAELAADDPRRLADDARAFASRVRHELHRLLRGLATRDFAGACAAIHPLEGEPEWSAAELEAAMAPYFAQHASVDLRPAARLPHNTVLRREGKYCWAVTQKIVDPEGEADWLIDAVVDLAAPRPPGAPLIALRRIGE